MTFASLFSGGEGTGVGAKKAGFDVAWGIEYDDSIAEIGNKNMGNHIKVMDILEANCKSFDKVDLLHASPPCPSFSIANKTRGETALDIAMAEKVSEFIRILQPEFFTLENVRGYASGFLPSKTKNQRICKSFGLILAELEKSKYKTDYSMIDCANFGVPQNRKRLLLRASKSGWLPDLPEKEAWKGWYQAIEDLIPTLPESKFANWQLRRLEAATSKGQRCCVPFWVGGANRSQSFLDFAIKNRPTIPGIRNGEEPLPTVPADTATNFGAKAFIVSDQNDNAKVENFLMCVNGMDSSIFKQDQPSPTIGATHGAKKYRAFIISDQSGSAGRGLQIRQMNEPVTTIRAKGTGGASPRAWLEQGKVVSMTPRALARFQTFPDWYELPEKSSLACKIIGNAVPSLMYEKIAKQFLL